MVGTDRLVLRTWCPLRKCTPCNPRALCESPVVGLMRGTASVCIEDDCIAAASRTLPVEQATLEPGLATHLQAGPQAQDLRHIESGRRHAKHRRCLGQQCVRVRALRAALFQPPGYVSQPPCPAHQVRLCKTY